MTQATLLIDWLWLPGVDGISWTLQVQLKMYVFLFVLYKLKMFKSPKRIAAVAIICAICMAILSPLATLYATVSVQGYAICYVFMMGIMYCIYSLIGAIFCQIYLKQWENKTAYYVIATCALSFWFSIYTSKLFDFTVIFSYLVIIVLFAVVYDLRQYCKIGSILSFVEKISFSLYVIHGVNGYYLLSVLDRVGVHPVMAVILTCFVAVILAWILYKTIENPSIRFIKKLSSNYK